MCINQPSRLALAACLLAAASAAPAGTTTTRYTYNADGAMTAMTVQADGGAATRTYLTWDNFTPDAQDPSTGTLAAANGRLRAIGSAPGGTPQFRFDARDRLTAVTGAGSTEGYAYHAQGMLRQATLGGDALDFYYGSGTHPRIINQAQQSSGLASAHLGAARYLSDGTEQVLLAPRKDTAGQLDPATRAVSGYDYDPFGAQPGKGDGDAVQADALDLADNPFQYAGEYRDPLWGGVYLRTRWYHPDLPGFISRDPAQNLNRFAYAGGNPVMHVDPGGRNFFHGLEHFLQGMNRDLNKGVGGYFAGFFLAPIMGPLAIAADPGAFWQGIKTNRDQMDLFLALGVVSELIGGGMDAAAVNDVVGTSVGKRYGLRMISDLGIGGGQSIAAGASKGFKHFNWHSFGEGLSMTAGVSLFYRGLYGANVRSGFKGRLETLNGALHDLHAGGGDETLIFRVREKLHSPVLDNFPVVKHAPLLESLGLGFYHERLIAVSSFQDQAGVFDKMDGTQVWNDGLNREASGTVRHTNVEQSFRTRVRQYELVGRMPTAQFDRAQFFANPGDMVLNPNESQGFANRYASGGANTYRLLSNNCHYHAYYVLKGMGLR